MRMHPFTLVAIMIVVLLVGIVILSNIFGWKPTS